MTRHPLRLTQLVLAVAAALPAVVCAAPASDSAYRTDLQNSHVEDATSQGIAQVNMITCFMSAMRPDALVNKGNYIALLDKNKCDPNARSDSGNSGSNNAGSNAPCSRTIPHLAMPGLMRSTWISRLLANARSMHSRIVNDLMTLVLCSAIAPEPAQPNISTTQNHA